MYPKGIIYHSAFGSSTGEFQVALSRRQKLVARAVRSLGAATTSFAMAAIVFSFTPALQTQTPALSPQIETIETPAPERGEFSLIVPAIGATSKVIVNVDPFIDAEYSKALKAGVAHAKGTGLPGEGSRIYLFAHSTNSLLNVDEYNAVFYQLRKLARGDEIIVFTDKKYVYEVTETKVVAATDTSWIQKGSEEELVLQTCDPPGTTWRRLLVIAKPKH